MTQLAPCPSCHGLVPARAAACPHCDARVETPSPLFSKLTRGVLGLAGGGTLALTLMACYGMPPCDAEDDPDNDGYGETCGFGVDCDNTDPDIYPGADDAEGDGVDQNCDGVDGIATLDDAGTSDAGSGDDAGASDAGN